MFATAILLGSAQFSQAQASTESQPAEEQSAPQEPPKLEFLVESGILFPMGAQRNLIRRTDLTAAQLSYVVRPNLALTGSVGWARGHDIAAGGEPRLDIFTYDIGAELRPASWRSNHALAFSSFVGVGAGGRTYRYLGLDAAAAHSLSAYVTAGGEIGSRRVRLWLEVRDYLSGFKPLTVGASETTRSDVVALLGLRYIKRVR